jgi:hypothetical protein
MTDGPVVTAGRPDESVDAHPVRTDALTYLAVVNGTDLWVTADLQHSPAGRLALVHRHSKHVRPLPEPLAADLAGQSLPAGTVVAACRVADVLTDQDTGIWDIALLTDHTDPQLLPLAAHARTYPAAPTAPVPCPDGTTLIPYRTKDGRGALRLRVAEASAEATAITTEPGRLRLALEFRHWAGPCPTTLVLTERGGRGLVEVPLQSRAGRAEVAVLLHLLVGGGTAGPAGVWDIAVEHPAGRTPCGRTAGDVAAPRRVYRYATTDTLSPVDGRATSFRPYFTNDRHLAVEITETHTEGA